MSITKKAAKSSAPRKRSDEDGPSKAKPAARGAKTTAARKTPTAKTTSARPRIRATHSEVPDASGETTKRRVKAKPVGDLEKRKIKARATVQALSGRKETSKKPLGAASPKREETTSRRRSVPPPPAGASERSQKLALAIAAGGLEKKALGVEVIDVSGRVDYADFLVIMTGTSDRHVHAIAMGIEAALKKLKTSPLSIEGLGTASWVLMDFDDVVVHVFQEETRKVYDIEGLWVDAGRLRVADERGGSKLS